MRKIGILLIAVAAVSFMGCQQSLCGTDPFTYAAAPVTPDPWIMAAPPSIQLGEEVYEKQLALCDFDSAWLDSYQPVYHSRDGTEMVRGFLNESAFLQRNLLVEADIRWTDNGPTTDGFGTIPGRGQDWLIADFEFAFTRRLQVNGKIPLTLDGGEVPYGSLGGRILLFDTDGMIVSTNVDVDFSNDMVDWTPTLNGWFDLAGVGLSHWAFQTSLGANLYDKRDDQFLWTGGLSNSFALGTTGRWDAILEGGIMDGDWVASFGVIKPLDFLTHDLDLRSAIIRNFDDEAWAVNVGINWRF